MSEEYTDAMPTMDELFQQGVDLDRAKKVQSEIELPTDTYTSTPPLNVTGQKDEKTGRVIFRAYGAWTGKTPEKETGVPRIGRFGFPFSPDPVKVPNRRTGIEEYDRATKNWNLLLSAYKRVFGQAAETAGDLKAYVEQYPIGVRYIQFETDEGDIRSAVVNIFPVA